MKCPKCSYLGFERVDRCRNCGYDFSLTSPHPEPDLTIRRDTGTVHPLEDLSLIDAASEGSPRRPTSDFGVDLDRLFGDAAPAAVDAIVRVAPVRSRSAAAVAELPLPAPAASVA